VEHLEREALVQALVPHQEDLPHATRADGALDEESFGDEVPGLEQSCPKIPRLMVELADETSTGAGWLDESVRGDG
jgi:hypothetical protein